MGHEFDRVVGLGLEAVGVMMEPPSVPTERSSELWVDQDHLEAMAAAIRHGLSRIGGWGQWNSYATSPTLKRWVRRSADNGKNGRLRGEDPQTDLFEGEGYKSAWFSVRVGGGRTESKDGEGRIEMRAVRLRRQNQCIDAHEHSPEQSIALCSKQAATGGRTMRRISKMPSKLYCHWRQMRHNKHMALSGT